METKIKLRSVGVIIHNDKILCVKMNNNDFYCLPGGHIEIGEDSETAIIREIREETLYETKIISFLGIIENFFVNSKNINIHEVAFYYLLEPMSKMNYQDYKRLEDDHGVMTPLEFKWLTISEIEKNNFKPQKLITFLKNRERKFHLIIK